MCIRDSRVGVGLELTLEEDGAKLAVRDADGNRAVVYGERQPRPGQKPPEEARVAYRRSLEKSGCDAVAIVTPDYLHAEMTIACARAKKAVLKMCIRDRSAGQPQIHDGKTR